MLDMDIAARVHASSHRSDLGRWREAVCTPHPALAGHVEAMWFAEGRLAYRRDRILPRGTAHLLINLGPTQYLVDVATGRREAFREIWFSGPQMGFLETESPGGVRLLGVGFSAAGAHALTRHDQHELVDRVVDLTDLLGDGVRALRQGLLGEASLPRRFARVERWLARRIGGGLPTHPVTRWALDRLAASGGGARVGRLAAASGVSRKHLAALFRREVGLTPKRLARIYRFHRALARSRAASEVRWAELALDCGYYDQSHLIRDFRAFCGLSPERFLHARAVDEFTLVVR